MPYDPDAVIGAIPEGYFSGGGHEATGELERMLNAHGQLTRTRHESIVGVGKAGSGPGTGPQPVQIGDTVVLSFTVNTDEAFRQFKIPAHFVGDARVHIHWTKNGNTDQSGRFVRWRIEYQVFPGNGYDLTTAGSQVEVEDEYEDAGTTSRILYRTSSVDLDGFVPNYYVGMKVTAVTPAGAALTVEPALYSLDLTWTEEINR